MGQGSRYHYGDRASETAPMILLLDNYDSFVYNLDRYLRRLGQKTLVVRSDALTIDAIERLCCSAIVISPGPKTPNEAGCSLEVVRRLAPSIPILGVCLGHQAIGQVYGGVLGKALRPVHGKATMVQRIGASRLLRDLPERFLAGRYHSLILGNHTLSEAIQVTAISADDEIMAIEHVELPLFGVQFHPESILTEYGYQILANFLQLAGLTVTTNLPESDLGRSNHLVAVS